MSVIEGQKILPLHGDAAEPRRRLRADPPRRAVPEGVPLPGTGWYGGLKAALDFAAALAVLVVTAPVILAAVLLVKLTSRGPALYAQVRMGRNGRPFRIYKIRSMYHDCERLTGPQWCRAGDPRVTPVGRLLRLTHVDELPQLWNV